MNGERGRERGAGQTPGPGPGRRASCAGWTPRGQSLVLPSGWTVVDVISHRLPEVLYKHRHRHPSSGVNSRGRGRARCGLGRQRCGRRDLAEGLTGGPRIVVHRTSYRARQARHSQVDLASLERSVARSSERMPAWSCLVMWSRGNPSHMRSGRGANGRSSCSKLLCSSSTEALSASLSLDSARGASISSATLFFTPT